MSPEQPLRLVLYVIVGVPYLALMGAFWFGGLFYVITTIAHDDASPKWILPVNVGLATICPPVTWLLNPELPLTYTIPFAVGWAAVPAGLLLAQSWKGLWRRR